MYPVLLPEPQPTPVSRDREIDCKAATNERRMARQRKLFLSRSAAHSGSSSTSGQMVISDAGSDVQNKDLYLCIPDQKDLRKLFKKELKKSDVQTWGRIVLPKKEAENYLPTLDGKEGIKLRIRDIHSNQAWTLKYKYWPNNRSRMYIFESMVPGQFFRQNGLKVGDYFSLYEDETKNLYFSVEKAQKRLIQAASSLFKQHQQEFSTANPNNKNNNKNSSSCNTQVNDPDNNNTKLITCTYPDIKTNVNIETASNDTTLYKPYTCDEAMTEEDEWYIPSLLEDMSSKTVTLSADHAFAYGPDEANNSMDSSINSQIESSARPAIAGIQASSSSQSILGIDQLQF